MAAMTEVPGVLATLPPLLAPTAMPYQDALDEPLFESDVVDSLPNLRADYGGIPVATTAATGAVSREAGEGPPLKQTVIDLEDARKKGSASEETDTLDDEDQGGWSSYLVPIGIVVIFILLGVLYYLLRSPGGGSANYAAQQPFGSDLALTPGLSGIGGGLGGTGTGGYGGLY